MQITDIIRQLHRQARLLGACDLFTGRETTADEMAELLLSPQGREFCLKHRFPPLPTLRLFKGMGLERMGIYIDAGDITLTNRPRLALIGHTTARLTYDRLSRYEVTLYRGAKATITATDWAVVSVEQESGTACVKESRDHALII